jgi:hypothetical protein
MMVSFALPVSSQETCIYRRIRMLMEEQCKSGFSTRADDLPCLILLISATTPFVDRFFKVLESKEFIPSAAPAKVAPAAASAPPAPVAQPAAPPAQVSPPPVAAVAPPAVAEASTTKHSEREEGTRKRHELTSDEEDDRERDFKHARRSSPPPESKGSSQGSHRRSDAGFSGRDGREDFNNGRSRRPRFEEQGSGFSRGAGIRPRLDAGPTNRYDARPMGRFPGERYPVQPNGAHMQHGIVPGYAPVGGIPAQGRVLPLMPIVEGYVPRPGVPAPRCKDYDGKPSNFCAPVSLSGLGRGLAETARTLFLVFSGPQN